MHGGESEPDLESWTARLGFRVAGPMVSAPIFVFVVGVALACGEAARSQVEAPTPPSESTPESPAAASVTQPDPARSAPPPAAEEQPPVLEAPLPHDPLPTPGGGLSLRQAYERTQTEIATLSKLLNEKNREVVARYGRNDTPDALRVLTPIRNRLNQARRHLDQLTCRGQSVSNARRELEERRIPLERFRVDGRWVDAYVDAKRVDGDISAERAADLRFVISKTGQGVMNPSSRGAHTINERVVQALACFGLQGPPRSQMRLAPLAPPPAQGAPSSGFRFFKTCGDPVCKSYRGPPPGIPRCSKEKEGAPCSKQGATCDLANNCNMLLICTDHDPATRCPR